MTTKSLFNAQCKTFAIAKDLAYTTANVSTIHGSLKPPFCLRVVKQYRTTEMQSFRDEVANEIKLQRGMK